MRVNIFISTAVGRVVSCASQIVFSCDCMVSLVELSVR